MLSLVSSPTRNDCTHVTLPSSFNRPTTHPSSSITASSPMLATRTMNTCCVTSTMPYAANTWSPICSGQNSITLRSETRSSHSILTGISLPCLAGISNVCVVTTFTDKSSRALSLPHPIGEIGTVWPQTTTLPSATSTLVGNCRMKSRPTRTSVLSPSMTHALNANFRPPRVSSIATAPISLKPVPSAPLADAGTLSN